MRTRIPSFSLLSLVLAIACNTGSNVVSKAEYDQISTGMSYKQVVAIIGAEGTELARSGMQGVPGVMPNMTFTTYAWQNADGSNMNAVFVNGEVTTKAQFGLQ